jgi:sensor domain DACND-containing protein/sensor domain DACNH-containing protein/DisA checkpoint controller-like protein
MISESLKSLVFFHILDGMREGLSHFSGPSRVALIYAERPQDPVRVYDPQGLLRGHEPRLKEIYADSTGWRDKAPDTEDIRHPGQIYTEENLGLTGLISFGGRTRSIFYQMWFTEHHPDMCSIGPTERWLEHAVFLLSHDFTVEDAFFSGNSSYVLREYATHAVRDFILDELNIMWGWDAKIFVFPILDYILDISRTPEEGFWPRGRLVFVAPGALADSEFLVRFPVLERPGLDNAKHVRKLLQAVENSDRKLISYGRRIVGIATGEMPRFRSTADFRGDHGFLRVSGNPVCSFSQGSFHSFNHRPNLVHLEEALLESRLEPAMANTLFRTASKIVHEAAIRRHGCTLVLDLNERPADISGQRQEKPLDLGEPENLELAEAMAKLDGALHIGSDHHLHRFACLLDGRTVPGENLARGARYNSALRFTADHENIIVVVVSEDKPVSVIREGLEMSALCEWKPFSKLVGPPPTLESWIDE